MDELLTEARARKAKAPPKRRKRTIKPGSRKDWAFGILRDCIKAGDGNPQRTLFKAWRKKFRDDKTRHDTLQRRFLHWRRVVEEQQAKKSDI